MDAMQIANSPVMWIACGVPIVLVVVQALLFAKGAWNAGEGVGLTKAQMKKAMKSSAITSIGPSIVVLSGTISLLVAVGAPIAWMRLSMIGSVMFEASAAGIGTAAVGVSLGADTLTHEALAMALWTMILCSVGWVLFATFSATRMDKVQKKLAGTDTNKMSAIAAVAVIGVFTSTSCGYLSRPFLSILKNASAAAKASSYKNALAVVIGGIIMTLIMTFANKKDIGWLREWSVFITIISTMIIVVLL